MLDSESISFFSGLFGGSDDGGEEEEEEAVEEAATAELAATYTKAATVLQSLAEAAELGPWALFGRSERAAQPRRARPLVPRGDRRLRLCRRPAGAQLV